jgi:PHD/YefM family antitoxin component YafN of YafNO toxin-antitoxin module
MKPMKQALKPKRFVTNRQGKKVAVLLDIEDYQKLMAEIEELDSIRAYDAAKASGEKPIPFEKAAQEIERSRK